MKASPSLTKRAEELAERTREPLVLRYPVLVNHTRREVVLNDNTVIPVTDYLDEDGDFLLPEDDPREHAVMFIAGSNETGWFSCFMDAFEARDAH